MGAQISKAKCMLLPAQSGKTRKVQELIKRYSELAKLFREGDFNVFISANNRLLVSQTTKRMTDDLIGATGGGGDDDDSTTEDADDVIDGGVLSWTCGSKNKISANDLALQVFLGDVGMVILCANKRRVTYLSEMISTLQRMPFSKRINIWTKRWMLPTAKPISRPKPSALHFYLNFTRNTPAYSRRKNPKNAGRVAKDKSCPPLAEVSRNDGGG